MTQYFYSDGQNQFGPFNINELKDKNISKDTLVWYEGLNDWTKASEISELKTLLKSTPPPLIKTPPLVTLSSTKTKVETISPETEKKSGGKLISYIIVGFVFLGLIAFGVFYKNNSTNNYNNDSYEPSITNNSPTQHYTPPPPREKTPEELRQELYQKEKNKPQNYLSTTYSLKYKVLSGKDEISGRIYNSATMAIFKDVILIVIFSSGTDTELYREEYTIFDYVYPNSSTKFLIKTFSPKGTKKIGVYVKTAKAE